MDHLITEAKAMLIEARQMPFNAKPTIGWWREHKTIRLYHGTHKKNLEWILSNGLVAPTEGYTAGWVSLAVDPNTALEYASMSSAGGEASFRSAGKKAQHTPVKDRVVLVVDIPQKILLSQMADINYSSSVVKLNQKEVYDASSDPDYAYYSLTEVKFPKKVDPKYIVGYMFK